MPGPGEGAVVSKLAVSTTIPLSDSRLAPLVAALVVNPDSGALVPVVSQVRLRLVLSDREQEELSGICMQDPPFCTFFGRVHLRVRIVES